MGDEAALKPARADHSQTINNEKTGQCTKIDSPYCDTPVCMWRGILAITDYKITPQANDVMLPFLTDDVPGRKTNTQVDVAGVSRSLARENPQKATRQQHTWPCSKRLAAHLAGVLSDIYS